jgi:hypothetical protein
MAPSVTAPTRLTESECQLTQLDKRAKVMLGGVSQDDVS